MARSGQISKSVILVLALAATASPGLSAGKDEAAAECRRLAGPATAAAAVSKQAVDDYFRALVSARAACERAVIGPDPDPESLFQVAVLMQRDAQHALALEVFELAAAAGVAAARTKVGDYYNFGTGGIGEDHQRAVAEYRAAAEAGDLPAKATLAIMYQLGRGTSRDFRQMVGLLEEAANGGYHFAQLRLAAIYMNPTSSMPRGLADELGLPDVVKAAEMLERSAAQGNEDASRALKQLYSEDGPVTDPVQRAALIRRSAQTGDATAINALGFLHERGEGVDYDPALAASYYVQALETGKVQVTEIRGRVDGRTVDWDRATAVEFQRLLQERGLYQGPLDGLIGGGTLGAARRLAQ